MNINMMAIRRYAAFSLAGAIPILILVMLMLMHYDIIISICAALMAIPVMVIIGGLMTMNPFSAVLEGKGVLAISIDSTGILSMYISKVSAPKVEVAIGNGESLRTTYSRAIYHYLRLSPKPAVISDDVTDKEGKSGMTVFIPDEEKQDARFGMFAMPVIILNRNTKSFLTKTALDKLESEAIVKQGIVYMQKTIEDLCDLTFHFSRGIIELSKPKKLWYENSWIRIAAIVLVLGLLGLMAYQMLPMISSSAGIMGDALGTAGQSIDTVYPK